MAKLVTRHFQRLLLNCIKTRILVHNKQLHLGFSDSDRLGDIKTDFAFGHQYA